MGLLDMLLNEIDNRKRIAMGSIRGLLDNPSEHMGLLSQRWAEANLPSRLEAQDAQSVMPGMAAPMQEKIDNLATGGIGLHTVYHGSPHLFDKFDSSKIGTGEGAQVYGHGLYMAENPAVARDYASRLSEKPKDLMGNYIDYSVRYGRPKGEQSTSAGYLREQGFPEEHAPLLDKIISGSTIRMDGGITYSPDAMRAFRQLDAAIPTKGNFYKTDLADEAIPKMLDWDKPYDQQPQAVKDGLRQLWLQKGGNPANKTPWQTFSGADGESIHATLSTVFGGPNANNAQAQAAASEALRSVGIPGIKYLDQGSRPGPMNWQIMPPSETVNGQWLVKQVPNGNVAYRGASEQEARAAYEKVKPPPATHNYVVFDDSLLKILERQ